MSQPTATGELARDLEAARSELETVERRDAELRAALDDVDHDRRRCADALERSGWRSAPAEARGSILAENRRVIVADLERNEAARRELAARIAAIRERLKEHGHHE